MSERPDDLIAEAKAASRCAVGLRLSFTAPDLPVRDEPARRIRLALSGSHAWRGGVEDAKRVVSEATDALDALLTDLERAETRVRQLEEALQVYADPHHWTLRDLSCVWIGPRSYQPFPDAPGVAREALES